MQLSTAKSRCQLLVKARTTRQFYSRTGSVNVPDSDCICTHCQADVLIVVVVIIIVIIIVFMMIIIIIIVAVVVAVRLVIYYYYHYYLYTGHACCVAGMYG